jgi:single-strand selective monofunctional uracil DNA glycosylase
VGALRKPALADELVRISRDLGARAGRLRFGGKVAHVYNPLDYARETHEEYVRLAGRKRGVTLLLGMNPGPFGMAQTGVPFGEVTIARDWLGIEGRVRRPAREHPKRPVLGFDCTRSEVSGARLWGWARERYRTPARFFARFLVWNYCPLSFLVESGANLTPDKLAAAERTRLYAVCDDALAEVADAVATELVIGIGKFAETRARAALADRGVRVGTVLHPSPASPLANKGWAEQAERQLRALGAV